jgi:hypothetical protein
MLRMFVWLCAIGGCLLFGCSTSNTDNAQGVEAPTPGQSDAGITASGCMSDDTCGPGRVCYDNQCELGCGAMSVCPQNFECAEAGYCRPVTLCETSDQCQGGHCDCNGTCRPLPAEPCSTDLQCDVLDYCDVCAGDCATRSQQCESCSNDSQCASNALCRTPGGGPLTSIAGVPSHGVCLRQCQGSCDLLGPGYNCVMAGQDQSVCAPESEQCGSLLECENNAGCAPNEYCNARGRCQVGCLNDSECVSGTLCQSGQCLPPCDDGMNRCPEPLLCESGRCEIENGCATSLDCLTPETYCDRLTNLCVAGCEVDDDCQNAGLQCVSGSCRERGCSGNFQCAFGQVCELQTGQCLNAEGRHCEAGCDPQTEDSCGDTGICVSLQDDEGNALGDFCFEGCLEVPNECPQGYQCVEFEEDPMAMSGAPADSYCVRDCTYSPL